MPTREQILLLLDIKIEERKRWLAMFESQPPRGDRHWGGYKRTIEELKRFEAERDRLIKSNQPQSIATKLGKAASDTREEQLRSMLDDRGFSIHDWAKRAGVDFHTADNFLKGKTKPYKSTRKKLADALGVKVEDLPG